MTPEVLKKLEEVFALGGTDGEACFYAGISPQTLYTYQKEHTGFLERKQALKERPVLLARQTVVKSLSEDTNSAWRMLERKDPSMRPKQEVDHTTKGESINNPAVAELTKALNDVYRRGGFSSDGTAPGSMGSEAPDKE